MKRYICLAALLVTVLIGCKKSYFDINDNPNLPTEGSITPDLILPGVLHSTASIVGASTVTLPYRTATTTTNYAPIARWMGYWTRGGDYGPNTEEESYNITTGFGAGSWANWYSILYDCDVMEKKAKASEQKFYEGIAKVMKTIGFMYLVDTYNNVAYSKAFDLTGNILPAYDKGEDIYKDLLVQLDQAIVLINEAQPGKDTKLATADIMFNGDPVMWKKFINTQRLKLVVHLSQVNIINHGAELAKVTADGYLGSGQTAAVNPGYTKAQNSAEISQQNPFWDNYEQDLGNVYIDRYNRANNYVLNIFKNTEDIRYQYYFDPSDDGGVYAGYEYGYLPNPNTPSSAKSSRVSGPGLAKSPSQDQWLYTSVESMFLQAEAIQRGWIAGNAQTALENAVRESFIWLGVTDAVATANTYITSGNAIVDWATNPDKIKLIITQKYLGLVGINNFEAWTDYRRTGFPNVPKSISPTVGSNIPLRFRYPQDEYNYNPANAGAENNPDIFTSGIFWDK